MKYLTFLIPLLIGIAFTWASAFTTAYSRRWGERGGRMITMILRNVLGIPLWFLGFVLAWLTPAPLLFSSGRGVQTLGLLLIIAGFVPVIWGHIVLGWRTHMPSIRDTLVRRSLYTYVRHPIYTGGFLSFAGLGLLKPSSALVLACIIGIGYLIIQARLEEIDLVQRLPAYREYMKEVPRFVPRFEKRRR